MHRARRCLNLLLELRPPIRFCLADQWEVEGLQEKASSRLQLGVCVQDTKAGRARFEGAGLQRTPRLVFHSGWKCCLVFASFISPLSDPKKQLKSLKTVNLEGEKTHSETEEIKGASKALSSKNLGLFLGRQVGQSNERQQIAPASHPMGLWVLRGQLVSDSVGQIPGCGEPRLGFISAVSHYPNVLLEQHQNTEPGVL